MKKLLLLIGFASLTMNAQVPSYVPTNGLVAYYPFSGNANDVSGNANNGTNNGATLTTDRFGNANSAYFFNGSTNYINVPSNNTLNFETNNSFTLSYWINATSLNSSKVNVIINKQVGAGTSQDGWNANIEANLASNFRIQNGPSTVFCDPSSNASSISSSINYHITQVFQNGTFSVYVNGIQIITGNGCPGVIGDNSSNMFIGKPTWTANNAIGFNGVIDDIGIWNRALTQQEVTNLYNANQCFNNITVTDTLIINVGQLSYSNPITYANNIIITPNPASTQININFNNITNLNGGTLKIINSLGQQVATTQITTSGTNSTMQLATWGGAGMYFVQIINPQGQIVDIKKIILQ